jgi:hypothetical protein
MLILYLALLLKMFIRCGFFCGIFSIFVLFHFVFSVLGLKLRAFTLSHSTSPIFVKDFSRQGLADYLPGVALNHDPPDLCLLSN